MPGGVVAAPRAEPGDPRGVRAAVARAGRTCRYAAARTGGDRDGETRTRGLRVPNAALYQAELRPVARSVGARGRPVGPSAHGPHPRRLFPSAARRRSACLPAGRRRRSRANPVPRGIRDRRAAPLERLTFRAIHRLAIGITFAERPPGSPSFSASARAGLSRASAPSSRRSQLHLWPLHRSAAQPVPEPTGSPSRGRFRRALPGGRLAGWPRAHLTPRPRGRLASSSSALIARMVVAGTIIPVLPVVSSATRVGPSTRSSRSSQRWSPGSSHGACAGREETDLRANSCLQR
jgi:hypothetical protein